MHGRGGFGGGIRRLLPVELCLCCSGAYMFTMVEDMDPNNTVLKSTKPWFQKGVGFIKIW